MITYFTEKIIYFIILSIKTIFKFIINRRSGISSYNIQINVMEVCFLLCYLSGFCDVCSNFSFLKIVYCNLKMFFLNKYLHFFLILQSQSCISFLQNNPLATISIEPPAWIYILFWVLDCVAVLKWSGPGHISCLHHYWNLFWFLML